MKGIVGIKRNMRVEGGEGGTESLKICGNKFKSSGNKFKNLKLNQCVQNKNGY